MVGGPLGMCEGVSSLVSSFCVKPAGRTKLRPSKLCSLEFIVDVPVTRGFSRGGADPVTCGSSRGGLAVQDNRAKGRRKSLECIMGGGYPNPDELKPRAVRCRRWPRGGALPRPA